MPGSAFMALPAAFDARDRHWEKLVKSETLPSNSLPANPRIAIADRGAADLLKSACNVLDSHHACQVFGCVKDSRRQASKLINSISSASPELRQAHHQLHDVTMPATVLTNLSICQTASQCLQPMSLCMRRTSEQVSSSEQLVQLGTAD
jgi:hypothetical protein